MSWTDEEREAVIKAYQDAKPTPENTSEILAQLAEEFDKTPNGVRMILSKAEVYVTKSPAEKGSSKGEKTPRVSKADSIKALDNILAEFGIEVDDTITSKLTAKAAVYFTKAITQLTE